MAIKSLLIKRGGGINRESTMRNIRFIVIIANRGSHQTRRQRPHREDALYASATIVQNSISLDNSDVHLKSALEEPSSQ